ncbi:MAG: phospholipase [Chlorobiaceae bacterium]|nr:phospholipase [Chlorobiaceae bacterium]
MQEQHLEITISGRYLVESPAGEGPFPVFAGFHGYGQTAEDEMAILKQISGSERWICCSVEALHPFRNAKGELGACWMTRRDRELRIAENVRYVDVVLDRIINGYPVNGTIVLHGFSQGTGMACRSALLGKHDVAGVMLLGGDIPPEHQALDRMRKVHIARGNRDSLYPLQSFDDDSTRLRDSGLPVEILPFQGVHGPNDDYLASAGRFLQAIG